MHRSTLRGSRCLLGFATLCLLLLGSHASAQTIDEIVNRQLAQRHIPGLSVAAINDGKVVMAKGYGLANVELDVPATENTVYQIGSITKQFTATGILLLIQDGKLGLDEKISLKLTDLPAAWANVTVRQLLTHTSGIKSYTEVENFDRHVRQDMTSAELLKLVSGAPLDFPSGSKFQYSNTGFFLLGMILEKVSGKSYGDFLSERIFQPLGMAATRFNDIHAVVKNRATGYTFERNVLLNADFVSPSQVVAAGGLVSSVVDMAKWDAALGGDKLLPRGVWESMWTPTKLSDGTTSDYGFGWATQRKKGHRIVAHDGLINGFSAAIVRLPEDRLTVIVLANSDGAQAQRIAMGIAATFVPDVKETVPVAIADASPEITATLRLFLGRATVGQAVPDDFTPDLQSFFFPDRINQLKEFLVSLGTIKSMEVIEDETRDGLRGRRYRVKGEYASGLIGFWLTKDGKIAGLRIFPE